MSKPNPRKYAAFLLAGPYQWFLPIFVLLAWLLGTRCYELLFSESVRRLSPQGVDWFFLFLPDILFVLSLGLLGTALFHILGRNVWSARLLLLTSACLVGVIAVLETLGHQFLITTGSLLDSTAVHLARTNSQELAPVVLSEFTPLRWIILATVLLSPLALMVRAWPLLEPANTEQRLRPAAAGSLLAAGLAMLGFSFTPLGPSPPAWNQHAAALLIPRDSLGISMFDNADIDLTGIYEPSNIRLSRAKEAADQEPPNLVLIILESTGYRATSLDPSGPDTTPFLASLAQNSFVASQMRTIIAHTTKALATIHCGIEPLLVWGAGEAVADAIPTPCLANLLGDTGYQTAYFQSATQHFEARRQLTENFGFSDFFSGDTMQHEGLQRANYYGYEDMVLVPPIERWLRDNATAKAAAPHLISILTNGPHHDYQRVDRLGWVEFDTDNQKRNKYLNLVRNEDLLLERLFDLYRTLGLYDNTVFVIIGDHGEAFGEHGRFGHDIVWDETLHVPFLIHDGRGELPPQNVTVNTSQIDILPTLFGVLGLDIENGSLPGANLLDASPATQEHLADRVHFFSCWFERNCLAALRGNLKLVHHFDREPEELYLLDQDPLEQDPLQQDLAGWSSPTTETDQPPVPSQVVTTLRRDLFLWREKAIARYLPTEQNSVDPVLLEQEPAPDFTFSARFGDHIEMIGYDVEDVTGPNRNLAIAIVLYYRVLQEFDTPLGAEEAKRRVRASSPYQIIKTYLLHPGPGLYPPTRWKKGDLVRDRLVLDPLHPKLGHPLVARIAFLPGDGKPALSVSLLPNTPTTTPLGALSTDGPELLLPIALAVPDPERASWRLRKRARPAHDFIKVGWQRWRLREENPLRGYVVLFNEDETSIQAAGWAGDAVAHRAVDRVIAFHQGQPVAEVTPSGEQEDLEGYPEGEDLVIDFRLVGAAREAFHANELDFVAFKDRRSVGRVLKIPTKRPPEDS